MYSELVSALFDDCLSNKDLTAFKVVALIFGCFWKMSQTPLVTYLSAFELGFYDVRNGIASSVLPTLFSFLQE